MNPLHAHPRILSLHNSSLTLASYYEGLRGEFAGFEPSPRALIEVAQVVARLLEPIGIFPPIPEDFRVVSFADIKPQLPIPKAPTLRPTAFCLQSFLNLA